MMVYPWVLGGSTIQLFESVYLPTQGIAHTTQRVLRSFERLKSDVPVLPYSAEQKGISNPDA